MYGQKQARDIGPVRKVLVLQAQGPEFNPRALIEKMDGVASPCNLSSAMRGPRELSDQLA